MRTTPQLAVLFSIGALAFAGPKISPDLRSLDPASTAKVIVQYKHAPNSAQHDKIKSKGGLLDQEFDAVKGATYSLLLSALKDLENDDEVTYVSPDRGLHGAAASVSYDYTPQSVGSYGLSLSGGSGVGVAVIDSGIEDNYDLYSPTTIRSQVVYRQSFVSGRSNDDYGHGTHVAGIIAGIGADSAGSLFSQNVRGIAPGANLISLRVLDQNGNGTDSTVIQAIQQAIALKSRYNIRVINLSLGRPVFESYTLDPLCQAVESAWKAGIVVVVAAGNSGRDNSAGTSGYATITAPGNDPFVITVGVMKTQSTPATSDDTIASFSSKGPSLIDHIVKPDLVAPGNQIFAILDSNSTLANTYPQNIVTSSAYQNWPAVLPSNYFILSGSSMSAAVVSGASALMIDRDATLTPDLVKARLMKTASKTFPESECRAALRNCRRPPGLDDVRGVRTRTALSAAR